jgi:peptidyl-prolyl cis-trans isomerase A (cyclophilin A)
MGEIDVEVDLADVPATSANFLRCVEEGRYDGGRFHRSVRPDTELRRDVPIEVIQAGTAAGEKDDVPPIPLERTSVTGLRHVDGAVSMARGEPDSATWRPARRDRPSHRRSPSSRPVAFAEGRRVYDAWHG